MIKINIANNQGTTDITDLCKTITWSGNYQQCSRILDIELIQSSTDKSIRQVKTELGNIITLSYENTIVFQGSIFERKKHSESSIINLTCYDRGIYLKRNQGTYKFNGMAAEDIVRRICTDFSIPIGQIESTGIKISRSFIGSNLYSIIQTVYTLASEKTGKKYITYFAGGKLMIREKKLNNSTLLIESGINLMSTSTSESITNMINQVTIYNEKDVLVRTEKDQAAINSYGLMQSYLRQPKGENVTSKARKLIIDNGVEQKITIENLGNIGHITGNTVVVKESITGVYGLFMIDNDIHTWKNGQYFNKLVINFRNIMDEQSVGTVINQVKESTSASWQYLFKPGGE